MKFDILHIHQIKSTLQLEGNAINALKNSDIKRYGVRRFEEGRQFQTSRLGSATEDILLSESKKWGGPGSAYESDFAPPHVETREGISVSKDLIRDFEEQIRELIQRNPNFVFSGKFVVNTKMTSLCSNYGLDLCATGGYYDWHLVYQRKGSGNMFDGYTNALTAAPCVNEALKAHQEILNVFDKQVTLKNTRMPVLFVDAELPLEKLIESLSVRRYHEGTCLYAGKLGQQIFSPQVTLLDQSYDPSLGANQFFDGEGVVRKTDSHVFVDQGRFTSLMSDLRFGKKYNYQSTGNGLRSYNTGINIEPHSLRLGAGTSSWRKILSKLDRCLVVLIAAGGASNDLGEYSTPVQVGYIFEKGEIVGRAPQVTIKTSVSDCLGKDLIGISNDGFTPSSRSPCLISEMEVLVN